MNDAYEDRIERLKKHLLELGSCAVCYSGGLDSTVLMDIAHRTLGDNAVAVLVDVPMMADRQRDAAITVAESIGCRLVRTTAGIEELDGILANRHDRCYICKTVMYRKVREVADDLGIRYVINGEIVDDLSEDRPGMVAGKKAGIVTPLIDAGIRREDIVRYLGRMDLPLRLVKDTCMLMRYPEGTPVTMDDLRLVEELEAIVRDRIGLRQLRIRRTDGGYSIQTSSAEQKILREGFETIRKELESDSLRFSLNPIAYDH